MVDKNNDNRNEKKNVNKYAAINNLGKMNIKWK